MIYYATVGSEEFKIEIDNNQVWIDDEAVEVDLSSSGAPELFSALVNGKSYEVLITQQRQEFAVTLRGQQYLVQVQDERTRRLNAGRRGPDLPHGDLPVKAPIPGLVVQILVKEGDEVEEDQPLAILEAMKMENELRALRAGTIRSIQIAEGQRVEQNGVLMIIA